MGVAIILALGNLRYHEVDELRASVKRNLSDRRARAINNLRIRRACQEVSAATKLNELFDAVAEVLESGEFSYAAAQLSCNGHAIVNARAIEIAGLDGEAHDLKMIDGRIQWNWQPQVRAQIRLADDDLWMIRLPISNENYSLGYLNLYRPLRSAPLKFDVSYLTSAFQPAIAQAAERIFAHAEQSIPRQRAATAG
jgi:hypothetical protein